MKIADDIMRLVGESKFAAALVTETSNIYMDLGYDSLSFVCLLLKIEEVYGIKFGLMEMGECIQIDRLIALVEQKVKEPKHD